MPHFKKIEAGHIEADVLWQDMTRVPANSFNVGRSSPQESLGRATGLLIRSVKSNKELLLSLRDIVMPAAGIAQIRRGRCYAPANFAQHYRAD